MPPMPFVPIYHFSCVCVYASPAVLNLLPPPIVCVCCCNIATRAACYLPAALTFWFVVAFEPRPSPTHTFFGGGRWTTLVVWGDAGGLVGYALQRRAVCDSAHALLTLCATYMCHGAFSSRRFHPTGRTLALTLRRRQPTFPRRLLFALFFSTLFRPQSMRCWTLARCHFGLRMRETLFGVVNNAALYLLGCNPTPIAYRPICIWYSPTFLPLY